LPVSRFNPVVVEVPGGFVALGPVKGSLFLGPAIGKSVSGGLLLGLAPFGLLSCGSKVDDVAHLKSSTVTG
jgi:hypothetical protein